MYPIFASPSRHFFFFGSFFGYVASLYRQFFNSPQQYLCVVQELRPLRIFMCEFTSDRLLSWSKKAASCDLGLPVSRFRNNQKHQISPKSVAEERVVFILVCVYVSFFLSLTFLSICLRIKTEKYVEQQRCVLAFRPPYSGLETCYSDLFIWRKLTPFR